MSFSATNPTVPGENYVSSVVDSFPRHNRYVKVEASIENRYYRNFLPVNGQGVSSQINDMYTEFILTPSANSFFDLNTLFFEAKLEIEKTDGTALENTDSFSVVDGAGFLLLEKSSVFLNSSPVENNTHFGIYNLVKSYTHMKTEEVRTFGYGSLIKSIDTKINESFTAANDGTIDEYERKIRARCRQGIHLMVPITIDLASSNQFLMNGVEIRLRFDLAHPRKIITSSTANADYKYILKNVRLHVEKVTPFPSALSSFNKSLLASNSGVPYLHERVVGKTFIFSTGHSMYTIENPFSSHLPSMIYMFMIKQSSFNGVHNENMAYLNHCNLQSIFCEVNGNTVSELKTEFPNYAVNAFYHTLNNLQSSSNLLTGNNFADGRTIHIFNLEPVTSAETVSVEKVGNLRFSINLNSALTSNYIIFVLGVFNGCVSIDSLRRVKTNFLI